MVAGYVNYDTSSFDNASPLLDDDAQLEKIWKSEYTLKEFLDPKNYKTYDDLKKRLDEVLGSGVTAVNDQITDSVTQKPSFEASKPRKSVEDTAPFDTDDEDLDYFKSLAD
jgi:hypothetical protein